MLSGVALVERKACGGHEQDRVRQGEAGLQCQHRDFRWLCWEFATEVAFWCWPTVSSKDWDSFPLRPQLVAMAPREEL